MAGVVAYSPQELATRIGGALGLGDILTHRRTADLVAARSVFHRLAFLYLGLSVSEIADISGRSYSIIYYDIVKFPEKLKYDFRIKATWEECKPVLEWLQDPNAPRKPYTPPKGNSF